MALQGFDKEFYLDAKLAALQANAETSAEWAGKDTAQLESTLADEYGLRPEQHFLAYGASEGLAPNAYFDADEYVAAKARSLVESDGYSDVNEAQTAFEQAWSGTAYEHYLAYGADEGINPSSDFDQSAYLQEKLALLQSNADTAEAWAGKSAADVKAAFDESGLTPLGHFLAFGQDEGLEAPAVDDAPDDETPDDGGDDTPDDETPTETLVVGNGDALETTYSLEGYQALRFEGVDQAETVNIEGLSDGKRVELQGSQMQLNVATGNAAAASVALEDSTLTLFGDDASTLQSLSVTATGDSTLDLGSSAAGDMQQLSVEGDGNLTLSGSNLGSPVADGSEITFDASGLTGDLSVSDSNVLQNATQVTGGAGNDDFAGLYNATSVTAGAGNDSIDLSNSIDLNNSTQDSITVDAGAGDDSVYIADGSILAGLELDGGEGNDTVTIGAGGELDTTNFASSLSNVETLQFTSNVTLDAGATGVENLELASGGTLSNLGNDQQVTALAGGDSKLILEDAGETVDVATAFADDAAQGEALTLNVQAGDGAVDQGTLNLSGNGAIEYGDSGRGFDTIDASNLEGALTLETADYRAETITLGTGADTLNVAAGSTRGNLDTVNGFDSESDSLDVLNTDALYLDVSGETDRDAAFDMADTASADSANANMVFEFEGDTYVYANDGAADAAADNSSDMAIELADVTGVAQTYQDDVVA